MKEKRIKDTDCTQPRREPVRVQRESKPLERGDGGTDADVSVCA